MAHTSSALAPREFSLAQPNVRAQHKLFQAIMASRQQQVDREIARYLAATGVSGRLTDSIEREIGRRFLANSSRW